MTTFLTPNEYNDAQDKAQLGLLEKIIKSLSHVYKHEIGRVRSTEKTELARGQLYTCLDNLISEYNERHKRSERAAAQIQRQNYEHRLLEQSADYYDVEVMSDLDE